MANFMDYLDWRGDLNLVKDPFNEVDNLILSYLAYVTLDGIAPGFGEQPRSLREISLEFFEKHSEEELKKDKSLIRLAPYGMRKMAASVRFSGIRVGNYVNDIDLTEGKQFSAMELLLEDGTSFVAYRGTDDTIIGWKEDFELMLGEVLAEKEAVAYLNRVGQQSKRPIRVGGHSKGGHLAVFAATFCERQIQDRIIEIYNNDGPGFREGILEQTEFLRIEERIQRIIPESSIFGMLLEHAAEPIVIKSSQSGPMQHDGLSWEVKGRFFIRSDELSNTGKIFNEGIQKWISQMKEPADREEFIDDFFSVLEAPGVQTLTQLQNGGIKSLGAMKDKADTLRPETKKAVMELIRILLSYWSELIHLPSWNRKNTKETL